jgi:DNA-binding NarL/FixJ family response regulator
MLKRQRKITIGKYRRNLHNLAALLSLVWAVSVFVYLLEGEQARSLGGVREAYMKRSQHVRRGHSAVLVIDTFELRRAGLASLVKPWADSNGLRIVEFDPHRTLPAPESDGAAHSYKLMLLVIGSACVSDPEPQHWITSFSGTYADVPLVLVSDREDATEVMAALEAGVRGFVPTSIALPVAMQALQFIMSGGSFFPPAALTQAARTSHSPQIGPRKGVALTAAASMDHGGGLTARQQEVLEHLRQGASNKLIGRQLKLRESTVKVHIRHIMRKLGAVNRTQAALSAVHLQVSTVGAEESSAPQVKDDTKLVPSSRADAEVLEVTGAELAHAKLLPARETRRLVVRAGLRPTSR